MPKYNPKDIEPKWQKYWEKKKTFEVKEDNPLASFRAGKFYGLIEFPYPSGAGLHVGHPRSYTAMDAICRKRRMEGYNVLYPIGFDAFGLPTENYAIKTGRPPAEVTAENIATFTRQLKSLGFSFDWSRAVDTTDPKYYKWTQWIFLQLFKHGLAYKKNQPINWCPKDKIGLANEEVVTHSTSSGQVAVCERCGTPVEKREKEQWMLAITKYADSLLAGLDSVDYIERAKIQQRNWIGRSEGAQIDFEIRSTSKPNFLILHGYTGKASKNFIPSLKKQLEKKGFMVQAPQMPNTDDPTESEQVNFVLQNCKIDEDTVIIGHSLGGIVAMKALMKHNRPVAGLVLVAPAIDPKFPGNEPFERPFWKHFSWDFDYSRLVGLAGFRIVLSDLQEKKRVAYLEFLAQKLEGQLITGVAEREHFTGDEESIIYRSVLPKIQVFTTRPDTIFGATYLVIAPENRIISQLKNQILNFSEVEKYIVDAKRKTDMERSAVDKEKTGIELKGVKAENPANGEEISVWIADYVLGTYGTGAIMAVPAHDERDFEFAKKFGLPIKEVVVQQIGERLENRHERRTVRGVCVRDGKLLITKDNRMGTDEYILPGGGVEEGEDVEGALVREVREETGYKNVRILSSLGTVEHNFYHHYRKNNRISLVSGCIFELENDEVVPRPQEEIEKGDFFWLPIEGAREKLKNSPTFSLEVEFIDRFLRGYKNLFTQDGVAFNSDFLNGLSTKEAKEKMIQWLEEKEVGKRQVNYKLRDWVFSRQRYWGEPIPLVYCENCSGWIPLPEKELPLKLPEVEKYQPTDTGESPLAAITDWVKTECPKCGGPARRETDTMPNWAGSSWYFLRYIDPKNKKALASKENLKYWTPVDWYNGGMEHTVLHLLYSRFWNQFLYDIGVVPAKEPYAKRTSHGIILASDGEKMSKSRGNVVNPDDMVAEYGADALRTYILFMGPFDQAVNWDTNGLVGVKRFLERIWKLQEKVGDTGREQGAIFHQIIKKVTEDIEGMRFNTAIAKLMELSNELTKQENISTETFGVLLKLLSPFAPHIAEELWEMLGNKGSIATAEWPTYDPALIVEDVVTIAVQVNGKLRATLEVAIDESEERIKEKVLALENVQKWLNGKEPKKVIYVKGKLVSIVV